MIESGFTSPDSLFFNKWNSNAVEAENLEKLKQSIQRHGLFKPVVIREVDEGLEVIGGQHRLIAAKELGIDKVPYINVGQIDDDQAKEISLIDNSRYGQDDMEALAGILNDLDTDITAIMPWTEDDIKNIHTSAEFDFDDFDDDLDLEDDDVDMPDTAKAPKTHTMMRFKVPLEDAETIGAIIQKVISEHGFTESDQATNAGDALVQLLLSKEDE